MHQVFEKFFNPHSFRQAVPDVWAGFQLNIKMMVVAELLVLALALAIAIVRGLPGRAAWPLRALAVVYTDAFRGTPLLNDFVGLQKDTAIIGVIGVVEAAQQAQNFASTYFNFTGYVVAAIFFIYLTIPLARFTDHLIAEREARERAQAA